MKSIYGDFLSVYPKVTDDVLYNPGIGFNTFQRFNGDELNAGLGWTEGFPIDYQAPSGKKTAENFPYSTTSYFRVYWRYLEPERGKYNWEMIDRALAVSRERGQTMLLRVAPYGIGFEANKNVDAPDWYRELVGYEPATNRSDNKWAVDPHNPLYLESFGGFIRALGARYDGHPDLESVDLAIVGSWGEGAGTYELEPELMKALVDSYTDSFKRTFLLAMLTDPGSNGYILTKADAGYRFDCLGDLSTDSNWGCAHMLDRYPQQIIKCGVSEAWKKAPVSMEVCWVMEHWLRSGWDVDYIIDQSLKWHISTFNAKSSAVPDQWKPNVDRWLKKMGYRFALRHFVCPPEFRPGRAAEYKMWWENQGVAPCYRDYPLAFRLSGGGGKYIIKTPIDIRGWMPGDTFIEGEIFIPEGVASGDYELQIAMLKKDSDDPAVKFASEGRGPDGWHTLGRVTVQDERDPERFRFDLYYE